MTEDAGSSGDRERAFWDRYQRVVLAAGVMEGVDERR